MFRNLAGNLVLHEQIKTTDAKAKELRRIAERLVTKALRLGADLTVDEGHRIGHCVKDRLLEQFPNLRDVLVHLEPFPHIHEDNPS